MGILQGLRSRLMVDQHALVQCKTCGAVLLSIPAGDFIAATIDSKKTHIITLPILEHLVDNLDHEVVTLCMGQEKKMGRELMKKLRETAKKKGVPLGVIHRDTLRKLRQASYDGSGTHE